MHRFFEVLRDLTQADDAKKQNAVQVEYAQLMSGGGMHVRDGDSELEEIYSLDRWIKNQTRFGGRVYRRTIIVIDDWTEVTSGN